MPQTRLLRRYRRITALLVVALFLVSTLSMGYAVLGNSNSQDQLRQTQDRLEQTQDRIDQERAERKAQVNTAVCALLSAVPEGNARLDKARKDFACGRYVPPPGRPTPASGATVTVPQARTASPVPSRTVEPVTGSPSRAPTAPSQTPSASPSLASTPTATPDPWLGLPCIPGLSHC